MANDLPASLKASAADHAADAAKAAGSLLDLLAPGAGAFFGFMAGHIIPNQRIERLASYAASIGRQTHALAERQADTESRVREFAEQLGAHQSALFEDGALAASRATSDERIERIARVVADGLNANDAVAADQRRVLQLLEQVSDDELIVLAFKTLTHESDEFFERHKAVLLQPGAHADSSPEDWDRETLWNHRNARLVGLGLLAEKPGAGGRGTRRVITPLGVYLLRRIGLLGPNEH